MNKLYLSLAIVALAAGGWLVHLLTSIPQVDPMVDPGDAAARAAVPATTDGSTETGELPVSGVVRGPDERPLPGAQVMLFRVQSPWPAEVLEECDRALTGDDGSFTFDFPSEPDLVVRAEREGYARSEPLHVPQRSRRVAVQLRRGYGLRGRVFDSTGRPVPDCEVMVEPGPWNNRRAVAVRTRALGGFQFEDLASGQVRVTARHPKFQPVTVSGVNVGTQRTVRLRFRKRSFVIKGTVIAGEPPQPVADAQVRGYPGTWNNELFVPVVASTDAAGRFELGGIGRGNLNVQVWHPNFSTSSRRIAVSVDVDDLQFDLVPRSLVEGRLIGDGVGGTQLQLRRAGEPSLTAEVADDGTFAFDQPVSAGRAGLELSGGELSFEKSGGLTAAIEVEESERTVVDLSVVPASTVRGSVRDEVGKPLAEARVYQRVRTRGLFDPQELLAVTDSEGRFVIRGLPAVPLTFVVEHDAFAKQQLAVQGPRPTQALDLEPVELRRPGTIHGTVTRGGRRLEGALVFASNTQTLESRTVSDPDGTFRLANLPAGEYSVKAHYGALRLARTDRSVIVGPGQKVGPVALEFPGGRRLRGVVVDEGGEPIPNVLVRVQGLPMTPTPVDDSGRFVLEDVPDRALEVVVADPAGTVERVQSVPADERKVRLVLPWGKRGSLVGRVLGLPDREPVTAGIIRIAQLESSPGSEAQLLRSLQPRRVDMPGGRLRFTGIPAGRCQVTITCDGYGAWVGEAVIRAGVEADLREILLDPGAEIRGSVSDEAGQPIVGARVHLGHENDLLLYEATSAFLTDNEGRFRLSGVGRNWRRLVVRAEGYAPRNLELSIPDDLLRPGGIEVVLRKGRRIVVKVEGSSGRPEDLRPVVLLRDGEIVDQAYTDFGTAVFTGREPGEYELYVPEMAGGRRTVQLDAAKEDLAVTLRESVER